MSVMQKILRNVRLTKARVVLPELDDPRIKAAADRLITDEIVLVLNLLWLYQRNYLHYAMF